tara:strand:- start:371 stop:1450 length:1080 start_codon:yes stop_codon:yes gene_type:complete
MSFVLLLILFIISIILLYFLLKKTNEKYTSFMPQNLYVKNKGYYKNIYGQLNLFNIDNEYDEDGYRKDGFNRDGYNKQGYNKYGYNINGFNVNNRDKYGYDINGLNKDGYNKKGYMFNKITNNYYNKNGYDENGYDKNGYDENGLDKYGFDKNGINKYGFDISGINQKLRPNVYQQRNKIFNTYPFNVVSDKEVKQNNISVESQLELEEKLKQIAINELKKENDSIEKRICTNNLPSVYNTYGCNLFKYYNQCTECVSKGTDYCAVYDVSSCPSNMTQEECTKQGKWYSGGVTCRKNGEKLSNGSIFTCPDNFKCTNPPDANSPGFGCYGENWEKDDNLPPIDPDKNLNRICKYQLFAS